MKTSTSPAADFTFKTVQADGMSTMVAYRNGREHYRSCRLSHGMAQRFGREYCEAKNAPAREETAMTKRNIRHERSPEGYSRGRELAAAIQHIWENRSTRSAHDQVEELREEHNLTYDEWYEWSDFVSGRGIS